jgi:hypothetical protein
MTQPDVALTDYGLTLECGIFIYLLAPVCRSLKSLRLWFVIFFLSIGLAALVGGTVHGFLGDSHPVGERVLWPITMIVIGVTSLAGIQIAAIMYFADKSSGRILWIGFAGFLVYCFIVLRITDNFLVAIMGYLPALAFLGAVFLRSYLLTKGKVFLLGFTGICTSLIASLVQQARISIHPHYFDHNALYHVLQGAGLFMIFTTARRQGEREH